MALLPVYLPIEFFPVLPVGWQDIRLLRLIDRLSVISCVVPLGQKKDFLKVNGFSEPYRDDSRQVYVRTYRIYAKKSGHYL